MSFGFSAGDFLAAGRLVLDVVQSLQDVDGAKSEYQELIRELSTLEKALQHLDSMRSNSSSDDRTLQSIKFAALSCRQPLEQFLNQVNKYKKSLDVWAKNRASKTIAHKLRWGFGMKGEVSKLQGYLNLHVATINMLLAEHGLERMSLAQEKADSDNLQIRERLDVAQGLIERIGNSVSGQALLIQNTSSMIKSLMDMVCGEFRTSWKSLAEMVAKICVSTQQIYTVVLDIKATVGTADTRFTFFQVPLAVEDALGFKFPVPSEWDYGMLESHIRYRFREGVGSQDVKVGNWELFKTKNSNDIILPHTRLLPGLEITMAIILSTPILSNERCPIRRCQSDKTTVAPAGGRICCDCNTWFSQATKKRNGLDMLVDAIESGSKHSADGVQERDPNSGAGSGQDHRLRNESKSLEEQCSLKNVRWTVEETGDTGVKDFSSSWEQETAPGVSDEGDELSENGEEFAIDRNGNFILDEAGRRVPWRSVRAQESDEFDVSEDPPRVLGVSLSVGKYDVAGLQVGEKSNQEWEVGMAGNEQEDLSFYDSNGSFSASGPHGIDTLPYDPDESHNSKTPPILDDALDFLDKLKIVCADRMWDYQSFLDIMKDFGSGAIDTPGVIDQVTTLFSRWPELLHGFNFFLPPGYEIETPMVSGSRRVRVTSPEGSVRERIIVPPSDNTAHSPKRKRSVESNNWEYIPVDGIGSPEPKKLRPK